MDIIRISIDNAIKGVKLMSSELQEAVKEFFRVIVLAVIPIFINSLNNGSFDWRLVLTVGAIAGLRFVDKLLHKTGVAEKGLTRF